MAMTCCKPNGMPFQNDTGASRLLNASNETLVFVMFFSSLTVNSLLIHE